MIQGLNGNSIKNIDFQYLNNLNLPLDSRYYRYFTDVNSVPNNDYDYVGMIIFNKYDKQFYTCIDITGTGTKTYQKLSDNVTTSDMYQLVVSDEDYSRIDTLLGERNINPKILHILPLNKLYINGKIINTEDDFIFNDKLKVNTLPTKYRDNLTCIIIYSENKQYVYDWTLSDNNLYERNLSTKFVGTINKKQIIHDTDSHTIYQENNGKILITKRYVDKFEKDFVFDDLSNNLHNITHNLETIYVKCILRYKLYDKIFEDILEHIIVDNNTLNLIIDDKKYNRDINNIKLIIYGK